MFQRFSIGDLVTFRFNGTTVEGRIVGSELCDNPHIARCGWRYLCRTLDGTSVHCHETQIGGVVTGSPCVPYMSHITGIYEIV